jgi:hypothetical protein
LILLILGYNKGLGPEEALTRKTFKVKYPFFDLKHSK